MAVSPSGVQVGQLGGNGGSLDISFSSTGARHACMLLFPPLQSGLQSPLQYMRRALCVCMLLQPCSRCTEPARLCIKLPLHDVP